jgi:mevalonate kinase
MLVKEGPGSELIWKSYDKRGEIWFEGSFDLMGFDPIKTSDQEIAKNIQQLLKAACRLNSDFLSHWKKYRVETYLEFDKEWGLGSSSTLVYCLAQWAGVNPYYLLFNSFGGSGYDIACADAEGPIMYQLGEEELNVNHVGFNPSFKKHLYFVYLGNKQSSEKARAFYYKNKSNANGTLGLISEISQRILSIRKLSDFEDALQEHESAIAKSLNLQTIQDQYFEDYWGVVKSLGAWGGDFALATSSRSEKETRKYFADRGLEVFFSYDEIIL